MTVSRRRDARGDAQSAARQQVTRTVHPMDSKWMLADGSTTARPLLRDLLLTTVLFSAITVAVVASWRPLFAADDFVVDWFNAVVAGSAPTITMLHFLTDLGGAQSAWLVIPLAVVWLLVRGAPRAALYAAVAGVGAAALDPGLKALVDRARPVVEATVATAPGASFPSGHALGSTVTYGLLALIVMPAVAPRHRRTVVGAAAAIVLVVGITRVALGVHHPSDVLGGWCLGVLLLGLTNLALVRPQPTSGVAGDTSPSDAFDLAPRAGAPLPDGARTIGALVAAATMLWAGLLLLGELLSAPSGVVLDFDAGILGWLVSVRGGFLSTLTRLVGRFGGTVGIVVGLVIAVVVALAITRRWRPPLLLVAAVVGETAIFLATVTIVERGRPEVNPLPANLPPTPSFPSGHAAAAAALYGAVALLAHAWARRWVAWSTTVAAVLVVVGVALARLYSGVHYPTDVMASLLYVGVWLSVCWHVLRPWPDDGRATEERGEDAAQTATPDAEVHP